MTKAREGSNVRCVCGHDNPPGAGFCGSCGRTLSTASADQSPAGAGSAVAEPTGMHVDWSALATNRLIQVAGVALLIYALLSGQWVVVLLGIGLAWVMREFAQRLDEPLASFWPQRDAIPRHTRMVLAFVLPMAFGLLLTITSLSSLFNWLPLIGREASIFVFMTAISTLIAYVLVREPRLSGAQ
jgi:hypothetical protein